MALDYSTLSDEELDAIAKDDYSRLSDATLKALTEDSASSATAQPESSDMTAGDVAATAGTVAAGAGLLYGAGKAAKAAAPYVMPAFKAAAPVLKKLPMDIARQYMNRPITGAVADVAALASGLPPPTMTQQTLSAMGQGSKAAAQNVVSTAPGPISPQAMQTPAMQALAQPPKTPQPAPQISNARNIVQQLALNKILPAVGNFASKALPAAQVAAGLFYTSPEEIAILKAAEEKKKQAQGIKR
jgi:hypothetical protein